MKIGIIGLGRFGELITKYLSKECEVYIFSRTNKDNEIEKLNAVPAKEEDISKMDIIIPCVPISKFEDTLVKIKDLLKEDVLVVDVCSVKKYPLDLMEKILPDKVQVLGTHPLFGPDSASESLDGKKIVLCKARVDDELYKKIRDYLIKQNLEVIEVSPDEHDKDISNSLILTHFIGRALIDMGADSLKIDTVGYKRLLTILETVENDTMQLFDDMNNYNSYSKETRNNFLGAINKVNKRLEK